MINAINIFLMVMGVISLIGMIGETKDVELKKGCTYGFLAFLIGLVIINAVSVM